MQDIEIDLPDADQVLQMTDDQFGGNQQKMNVDQRRMFEFIKKQIHMEVRGTECDPIRLFATGSAGTGM